MTRPGTVYLLGGGPGDPELVTERARRHLAAADLVLYDALIHPDLLRHCKPGAELRFVGKRAGRTSERQAEINRMMREAAEAGRSVARLKGGDPYLFGRGSEEAEHLAAHGIPFEVVPGVPSPLAATAYAGISLSHRDLASSIAYLTATESVEKDQSAHDWSKLATATQTLVIFMGVRKLDSLMASLIEHGRSPDCPAAVIQAASLPTQRTVVGTVRDIAERARQADIGMPALTVVGEVVRLREQLRWYDNRPLFGKRVVITRPEEQAPALTARLRDAGAEALSHAAIRIAAPEDGGPLERAAREAGDYDWVVFTSKNGVDAFFETVRAQGGDARRLGSARVAAIGPATAEALAARGIVADRVPGEHRGEEVAREILADVGDATGMRVLLPRAAVAREALPDALRAAGARVDVVAAYRTLGPTPEQARALAEALSDPSTDAVTFTSSSTVDHTVAALGDRAREVLGRLTVVSIGPITTRTAEGHRLRVDVSASTYTVEGLVSALEAHFAETP